MLMKLQGERETWQEVSQTCAHLYCPPTPHGLSSIGSLGRNIILTTMPAGTKLIAGNKPVSFVTAQQFQQLQQQGQATQVSSHFGSSPGNRLCTSRVHSARRAPSRLSAGSHPDRSGAAAAAAHGNRLPEVRLHRGRHNSTFAQMRARPLPRSPAVTQSHLLVPSQAARVRSQQKHVLKMLPV